jgi:predicted transcriptional regulator
MKTIALKLSDELLAQIQHAAKTRGETKSAIMREVLEDYFSKKEHQDTCSCLDLARDLAGSLQGPSDLATNPAHMDGYGR